MTFSVYPADADGDALRRVAGDGSDMSQPMDIDFSVAAPIQEIAEAVASRALELGYRVQISFDDSERDLDGDAPLPAWSCYCTKTMLATYDGVVAAQRELNDVVAPLGAWCDGWGTFGNVKGGEQGIGPDERRPG